MRAASLLMVSWPLDLPFVDSLAGFLVDSWVLGMIDKVSHKRHGRQGLWANARVWGGVLHTTTN